MRQSLLLAALLASLLTPAAARHHDPASQHATTRARYPIGGSAPSGAQLKILANLPARIARWRSVEMPFRKQGMNAREIRMVGKLVEASRQLESIYWRQSDAYALTLNSQLRGSRAPRDQQILRYLQINGGEYDVLDGLRSFITAQPAPAGRGFYPEGITRAEIEHYVAEHPDSRAELYSPRTVVRSLGTELVGLPYHSLFRTQLMAAAQHLREAAALSDDAGFAAFLRARADALLSDDYGESDRLWLGLKQPKVDLIFAPYLTYLDQLLGVKASYGAAILVRNAEESRRLELYQNSIPQLQQALPLTAEDKPVKDASPASIEVVDSPLRTGDWLHGYQAVAATLPLDPALRAEKGAKTILFRNFLDARFRNVVQPVARRMMDPAQASLTTPSGYFTTVALHEIAHTLGPVNARREGKVLPIAESLGPIHAPLEEAKADAVGMFAMQWLIANGVLPQERQMEFDACYLAGILRAVRMGNGDAHGQAQLMEFNYLFEQGAITSHPASRTRGGAHVIFAFDMARLPAAIDSLSRELLEMEASGDRARAEQWFARYGSVPQSLSIAMDAAKDIPVEITPKFSWPLPIE